MREPKICIFIQAVQLFAPVKGPLFAVVDWLSAAAYAAAWTGHHFYEIIVHFAALDHIQQSPGISQSADYSDPYSDIINSKFCFHNPVVFLESRASDHLK